MHDFGKYQLLAQLPNRAVAKAYRAVERTTGVEVEIYHYVLRFPIEGGADERERVLREATQASRLSHPGIARILDSGESEGRLYLATEIVEGTALNFREGAALDHRASLDLLQQAAAALDYAHSMGVLHLSLEPAKMKVDDAGRLRLRGFGETTITDLTYDMMRETMLELMWENTFPHALLYGAPERIMNQTCDAMADQFSLAAIGFQMFTGERPFYSEEGVRDEFFRALQGKHVAAHEVNPAVPQGVSVALGRGLASQPEDRFRNCGELVSTLEAGLREKRP